MDITQPNYHGNQILKNYLLILKLQNQERKTQSGGYDETQTHYKLIQT